MGLNLRERNRKSQMLESKGSCKNIGAGQGGKVKGSGEGSLSSPST